ncbi:uncharacterized protein LOC121049625 [Rosa chinensis]|uniref:uncharacterized protein LOC121049625 n=1 Tax=Rosa chinensis TaxID=74649 RepID=UPI001AD913CE|nr:uncharacterized protein LOC121049625 [Rosa chinensis]
MEISALNLASLVYINLHYNCHNCTFFPLQTPRLSRIFFSRPMGSGILLPQALIQFSLCPRLETLHLRMPAKLPRISSTATYGNLKQLNLDIILFRILVQEEDDVDVNCVLDLLKAAPLLEELIILVVGGHLSETNPQEMRNHSGFTNDHLKMVKMKGFLGHWYETQLAIGILENAPKLKVLVIDPFEKHYSDDGKYPENYSEQHMAVVEEKLKGVKTDAQILFL